MIKEFKSLLNTPVGIIFPMIFICLTGSLLWFIPGDYNILQNKYASLDGLFSLLPFLLIILVPVLSMRSFSEEKKSGTLELLLTRPISLWRIIGNKTGAIFLMIALSLVLTLSSFISIYYLAIPIGNVDTGAILASYFGMLILALVFISMSVFASSLTSNQALAFIFSLVLCSFGYYGFDLLSNLFSSGEIQVFIQSLGLLQHVSSIQRGIINSRDLIVLLSISAIFYLLTYIILSVKKRRKTILTTLLILLTINFLSIFFHYRWDLTEEKCYTISPQTKQILHNLDQPLEIQLYLSGNLNAGFTRLKQAVENMLTDFSSIVPGKIHWKTIDPHAPENAGIIKSLSSEGIQGIAVNEHNKEGGITQQIVFPWLKIKMGNKTLPVSLLIHMKDKSGEENLNMSIENIEYELIRNIYLLTQKDTGKIAFLEGHGEFSEEEVQYITNQLSNYYQIDRGRLTGNISELNDYKTVVIAGARFPFSERDKFILDQYLMQGGKLLFFLNGVKADYDLLASSGQTPTMANDVNLQDILFVYGIRINPVLIQDVQCINLPVSVNRKNTGNTIKTIPWHYAPLLTPNPNHPITKDLMLVKSEFTSTLDFIGNHTHIEKTPLLYSSDHTHVTKIPEMVTFQSSDNPLSLSYFNEKHLMAAALLEGNFISAFQHRPIPENVSHFKELIPQSPKTKIIVVASEEIISNEKDLSPGYDKYSQITFDNTEFIIHAVNYLADDWGLMKLRNKQWKIRLLDKQKIQLYSGWLPWINILVPSLILLVIFFISIRIRKKKYFH